jgi:hypothetical protein
MKDPRSFGSPPPDDPNDSPVEKKDYYKKTSKYKKKFSQQQGEKLLATDQRLKQKEKSSSFLDSAPGQLGPAKTEVAPERSSSSLASKAGSIFDAGKKLFNAVSPHTVTLREPAHDRNDTARLFGLNYNYPLDALTVNIAS